MDAGLNGTADWRQVFRKVPIRFGMMDYITCTGGESQGMSKHRFQFLV